MNKNRQALTASARKKAKKTIHDAQSAFAKVDPPLTSDTLTPEAILKRYPSKIRNQDKILLDSTMRGMNRELKGEVKRYPEKSKRTTPGKIEGRNAAPAHVLKEGRRWEKNLKLQTAAQKKSQQKIALKRK